MKDEELLFELLSHTIDDLSVGVGIFYVPDLKDIRSIQYVFMNRVILYEMRKTREEVFGKKVTEVAPEAFDHEGGVLVLETYRKVAEEGGMVNLGIVEYSNHMVAGFYECTIHGIKKHYVYIQLRNVTDVEMAKRDLEERNEKLADANQRISKLMGHIAHDLRNPMANVASLTNILLEDEVPDKEMLSIIQSESNKALDMTTRILDVTAIRQGKVQLSKKSTNIKSIIDLSIARVSSIFHTSKDRWNAEVDASFEGEIDPIRFEQIFDNLFSNSLKYSSAESKITLMLDSSGQFQVSNSIASEEEIKAKIRLGIKGSTGYGVEIVSSILEAHDIVPSFSSANGIYSVSFSIPSST